MEKNPYKSPQAADPLISPHKSTFLPCVHCGAACDGPVAIDSWGFREFECNACRNMTTLALPRSYRVVYWLVLLGCIVATACFFAQGMLLPAVFGILPGY